MVDCSFCGTEIPKGTGTMYVKKTGKILFFCKKKCEKNSLKLGRKAAKLKWTEEYRKHSKSQNARLFGAQKIEDFSRHSRSSKEKVNTPEK